MAHPDNPSENESSTTSQFTVDLGQIELTDEEIANLGNIIAKAAVESVRNKRKTAAVISKEPYVKILYVRSTFARAIHP